MIRTQKPDRIVGSTGFRFDGVRKQWTCQTCGVSANSYLRHGEWHERLNRVIRELRHLTVAGSDLGGEELAAILDEAQEEEAQEE